MNIKLVNKLFTLTKCRDREVILRMLNKFSNILEVFFYRKKCLGVVTQSTFIRSTFIRNVYKKNSSLNIYIIFTMFLLMYYIIKNDFLKNHPLSGCLKMSSSDYPKFQK